MKYTSELLVDVKTLNQYDINFSESIKRELIFNLITGMTPFELNKVFNFTEEDLDYTYPQKMYTATIDTDNTKELVDFGNYLLRNRVTYYNDGVTHADLCNWRDLTETNESKVDSNEKLRNNE